MEKAYEPDVVRARREVPGELAEAWVRQEVVRRTACELAENRSRADRIASALFTLAMANDLPGEQLHSVAMWAWDAPSLADDGYLEQTRDQVIDRMLDALRKAVKGRSSGKG